MALGQGRSVPLQEDIDPNYEPSAEGLLQPNRLLVPNCAVDPRLEIPNCYAEIADYAQWLGLDLEAEKELAWICREGLKAKLPVEWKAL